MSNENGDLHTSWQGGNLHNLLERVIQMNALILEEMNTQRKEFCDSRSSQAASNELTNDSSSFFSKFNIRLKEFNGAPEENVVTWLVTLDEVMEARSIADDQRMTIALPLLGGTALQWFVNLKIKNQRPSSWLDFKTKITAQFQPADFQENLRHQLLNLRQKHSLQDYIHKFRSLLGQIISLDDITQVMFFTNGLSPNTSLYVRSKHPLNVEAAIREATTYDNMLAISKHNHMTYDPFLEHSSGIELNHVQARRQYQSTTSTISKDQCFKLGLCFYCKEPGHRALKCPKKAQQSRLSTVVHSAKND